MLVIKREIYLLLPMALFLVAGGIVVGCGQEHERGALRPKSLQRLVAEGDIGLPALRFLAHPESLVCREEFEGLREGVNGIGMLVLERGARLVESPAALDGSHLLRLDRAGTARRRVPVAGRARYVVSVFMGSAAGDAVAAGAGVDVSVLAGEKPAPGDVLSLHVWHRAGPWVMLGGTLEAPEQATALEILLRGAEASRVEFDALRVVRVPAEEPRARGVPPAVRVTLGARENRWIVPLFVTDRFTRELDLPRVGPHFELALAALSPRMSESVSESVTDSGAGSGAESESKAGGAILVRVLLTTGQGQDVLLEQRLGPAPAAREASWREIDLPLEKWAGRHVTLSVESEARGPLDPDGVVLLGSPIIRSPSRDVPPPPVIVVSIDTLRRDRLGLYGYERPTSPFVDSLAQRGVTVDLAYSPSSYTLPTHASLLTGQEPRTHGIEHHRLSRRISPILAEILAERGYATIAATGGGYLDPSYGFAQGFDVYTIDDPLCAGQTPDPDSSELTVLLERIESLGGAPFFLFLHTFAVHDYAPREEDRRLLCSTPVDDPQSLRDSLQEDENAGRSITDSGAVARLSEIYDAAILGTDRVLERFFRELERQGILGRAYVVVTSDHGEEFLEHGRLFHRHALYEESIRVPQIWLGPGLAAGHHASGPLSLVDVAPTLIGMLGLPRDRRMQGLDVSAHLRGAPLGARVIGAGLHVPHADIEALVAESFKLIRRRRHLGDAAWVELELYDLATDPTESRDLAETMPDLLSLLDAKIDQRRAAQTELGERLLGDHAAAPLRLDADARRRLDELGYAGR